MCLCGHHRLREHRSGLCQLDTVSNHLRCLVWVVADQVPRLVLLNILVAKPAQLNADLGERPDIVLADCCLELVDRSFDALTDGLAERCLRCSVVVSMGEQQRTIPEVAECPNKLAVDPVCKPVPGEIHVLFEPSAGEDVVPERRGVEPGVEILLGPDCPTARGRQRLPFDPDVAGREHRPRFVEPGRAQHRGPEDCVVLNNIFADDVCDLATLMGPVIVPGPSPALAVGQPDLFPVVAVGADLL